MKVQMQSLGLLATLLLTFPAVSNADAWRMCDGCSHSQKHQCAVDMAHHYGLVTGNEAWVFDFAGGSAAKFYLQVTPPGSIVQGEDGTNSTLQIGSPTVYAFQEALSDFEIEVTQSLFDMVQQAYRPLGLGFDYPSCTGHAQSSGVLRKIDGAAVPGVLGQTLMTYNREVPGGPNQGSAYDVIGFHSRAVQLARDYGGALGKL